MRGVTKHSSLQGWLKSKAPGSGGGGKFLSGWKGKDGKGEIHTWMHTKCLPLTAWRHGFPTIVIVEDKKTGVKVAHVWNRNHTCHETEDVLDKLYWRETKGDPTSARSAPPERCSLCKFAEYLWQQCWIWLSLHRWVADKDGEEEKVSGRWALNKAGKKAEAAGKPLGIDPCSVVFDFVSEAEASENTTIHAGGFCGLFGRDELPDDLLKAMAAAKIRAKEAWKENCMVKPKSVMCVVDNDKPEKGVQISEETKELGEKVKEEIVKVWEGSEIDIQRKPYCVRWTYDRSKNMGKQYTATAIMKIKPDPRILTAIRGDAPDLSSITDPFNQQSMRSLFEHHCKLKGVPWAEIFPTKEQEKKWAEEDEEAEKKTAAESPAEDDDEPGEADDEDEDDDDAAPDPDVETDDEGEELVACDACKKAHKISAAKCPHCGHDYEVEADPAEKPEPPPPPPAMRSRSDAKKAASAAPAAAAGRQAGKASDAKKKAEEEEEEEEDDPDGDDDDGGQDDEIPF